MKVMLLDENVKSADALRYLLKQNTAVSELDYSDKPAVLLQSYQRSPAELVFIRLGNTSFNGLKTAKQLLKIDARAKVVFISHSRNYALYAFEAGAVDYLLEPLDERKLCETLNRCFTQLELSI